MIIIRKTNDAGSAYKVAHKLGGSYFNKQGLEGIEKGTKEREFWGAFEDDKMVGFVTYKEINPEVIEMTWLAVDPDYQNQGIGTQLIEESLAQLDKLYKICEVKTLAETAEDEGYEKTRNFYKQLNFISLEVIDSYPGWGKDNPCQIFVKLLN